MICVTMNQIILQLSVFVMLGILMFSLGVFLPANASTDDKMMGDKKMMNNENMAGMKHMESPRMQLKHGVMYHDVKCNNGFALVLKSTDNSPACVKSSSVHVLVVRGWALSKDMMMKMMNQDITNNMKNDMKNETMTHDNKMAMNDTLENKSINKTMSENKMPNDSSMKTKSTIDESQYRDAPTLVGITDYINTTPVKLAQEMKGKVVVYDFWTYTCINCIHTLPHVVDLSNKYLGKVLVIGVHSPEFEFEKDINNVKMAVQKYGLPYPVVLDNDHKTWDAFGNHYWPHVYVADSHGKIRYDHIGEGSYDEIDKTVENLLLEQDSQKPKDLMG